MLPVLQIGPLALQTPGLILLAGMWIGLNVAERYARLRNVDPSQLYNLVFTILISGVIGARFGYAAIYAQSFMANPASLLSLNPGLLDLWSGLAASTILGIIFVRRKKMHFWGVVDALVPLLAILQIAIGLANLASGDGYGEPTTLPWAFNLWGTARHPSQLYEIIAGVAILWLTWPSRRLGQLVPVGATFLWFLAASAGAKLFLEGFRGDSYFLPGGIRGAQVFAWGILALSLIGLDRLRTINPKN
jgi:prolipoprotein diacylglyceryltransferase